MRAAIDDCGQLGQPVGVESLPSTIVAKEAPVGTPGQPGSGLSALAVSNRFARAEIFLQGAHVTAYRPQGGAEVLWTSAFSRFQQGTPIRGGIPLCFPWFGPAAHAGKPAHGFARTSVFELASAVNLSDGRTQVTLVLQDSTHTRAVWDYGFELQCTVTVGPALELALQVRNTDVAPFFFEEALHSYFDVSDVRHVAVHGLEDSTYFDKVDGGQAKKHGAEPLCFSAETDRVYEHHTKACRIADPGFGRSLIVDKSGSNSTVAWNPWIAKAARTRDFGDHEWPSMVCVESANIGTQRVALQPGQSHVMNLLIRSEAGAGIG